MKFALLKYPSAAGTCVITIADIIYTVSRKKGTNIVLYITFYKFKHIVLILGQQHPGGIAKLKCSPRLINVAILPCKIKCSLIHSNIRTDVRSRKKTDISAWLFLSSKTSIAVTTSNEDNIEVSSCIQNVHRWPSVRQRVLTLVVAVTRGPAGHMHFACSRCFRSSSDAHFLKQNFPCCNRSVLNVSNLKTLTVFLHFLQCCVGLTYRIFYFAR